jgi:hypothetical protein
VRDRAEVERRLGFTRARITHLPDLQERILFVDAVDGVEPMSERALPAAHAGSWVEQRSSWKELRNHEPMEAKCL